LEFYIQKIQLIVVLIAILFSSSNIALSKVLRVEKQNINAYKTIQDALNSASDGDSILVGAGTYSDGKITILKSISLITHSKATLDGNGKNEILIIAAKNVTVKGFNIINSSISNMDDHAAIRCFDAHNVKILNNNLRNNFFGIHLSNTDSSKIIGNTIISKSSKEFLLGNGIHLWKCNVSEISNNKVEGQRDGFYFEFATNCKIINNISEKNLRYGLHFMFSHNNHYQQNIFKHNGAGVAVMYTTNVTMIENSFIDNWGESSYGILLKDIRDSKVINNIFSSNTIGIYMEGTSRTQFENNTFKQNGWALKLMASCDDNVFNKNNFIANTFDISTNGRTVLNTFDMNYWDKYEGYDLDRNGIGDVAFHPVNLFSYIVGRIPSAIMLWRSFLVFLLDKSEKMIPAITPENLKDNNPVLKAYDFN